MSARITVQSGIAAGTSHLIEGRVARVGSDPQSEVCLPTADIPGHALTLEFREDACRVYNRCRSNVLIGSQVVQPEQVAAWSETDVLQLGEDVELILDFDDGQTFESFAEYDYELEEESGIDRAHSDSEQYSSESDAANSAQTKTGSSVASTILQLGVTVICLLGCVALLVRDQNIKDGPDSGPGFSEVISASFSDPDISPELIKRIQHAEAQLIRGRTEFAQAEYRSIRDDLTASTNGKETQEEGYADILQFLQTRLTSPTYTD